MKHAYEISMSMHHKEDLSVRTLVEELRLLTNELEKLSPSLNEWLLTGETRDSALLYDVFSSNTGTTSALAVLETRLKGAIDPRIISIWNGKEGHAAASLRIMARPAPHLSLVTFVGRPLSFLFPAHAGMNRPDKMRLCSAFAVPRARGDEPTAAVGDSMDYACSPRTRG